MGEIDRYSIIGRMVLKYFIYVVAIILYLDNVRTRYFVYSYGTEWRSLGFLKSYLFGWFEDSLDIVFV